MLRGGEVWCAWLGDGNKGELMESVKGMVVLGKPFLIKVDGNIMIRSFMGLANHFSKLMESIMKTSFMGSVTPYPLSTPIS